MVVLIVVVVVVTVVVHAHARVYEKNRTLVAWRRSDQQMTKPEAPERPKKGVEQVVRIPVLEV